MARKASTLLEPGHEAEWAQINRDEAEQQRESARALSPAERIAIGQRLSRQAFSLLVESVRAGHAPERALRT